MKLLKNFVKYSEGNPEPGLRFRYCRGLGDFIACILHSKYIGPITHRITGEDKPCEKCSQRAMALNIVFPIAFWKLFFSSEQEMVESFKKDLEKAGYIIETHSPVEFSASKTAETPIPQFASSEEKEKPNCIFDSVPEESEYELINAGDNYIGEFMIRTFIYKQKNGHTSN